VRLEIVLVSDPKLLIEQLESTVEGIQAEISKMLVPAPQEGQNSLAPIMEFLQQQSKDLLKERALRRITSA
jgi:hypothetical protein